MPRGRAPGYADQREHIVACAAMLFAHRGYSATTMNELARECGMSKATLYHYYRDKYALLVSIAEGHVQRLQALVEAVESRKLAPEPRLRELIRRVVEAYADQQHQHRVLTEDVKFLVEADRERILDQQRAVVAAFARALVAVRPDLKRAKLAKPLTMLLFGMVNWMFTWMRPDGTLTHADIAPLVADLFFGGLHAVARERKPVPVTA